MRYPRITSLGENILTEEQKKIQEEYFKQQEQAERVEQEERDAWQARQEAKRITTILDAVQNHPFIKELMQLQKDKLTK